jgi:hypothetical protein
MIDDNQGFSINTLSGLELAKHVLVSFSATEMSVASSLILLSISSLISLTLSIGYL